MTKLFTQSRIYFKFGFTIVSFIALVISLGSFVNKGNVKPQSQKFCQEISQAAFSEKRNKSILHQEYSINQKSALSSLDTLEKPLNKTKYFVNGIETKDIKGINTSNIANISIIKAKDAGKVLGSEGKYDIVRITTKDKTGKSKVDSSEFKVTDKNVNDKNKIESYSQEEDVFTQAEQAPQFPGGQNEMYRFLGMNIKYPAKAQRSNKGGKVYLKFIVEKDGSITNVIVQEGPGFGMDEEAIRVVKLMPKWVPAKQNNKIVRCYFNMPIVYKLD